MNPMAPLALLALLAPAPLAPLAPLAPHAHFDHLVVAIRSLPDGIAEFERLTGVKAAIGGKHPGRGTGNALVSLGGGSYLEILAPLADATLSARDEAMRRLDRLTIINWAVGVDDVSGAVAALRKAGFGATPPQPGSRVTPSGDRLEWTTFGLGNPGITVAPFFIHWSAGMKHPSTTAPAGCELSKLTIQDPASARLSAALGAVGVAGVTYAQGAPRIEARLTCGTKAVTLTSAD
jgi:hypothetical protein